MRRLLVVVVTAGVALTGCGQLGGAASDSGVPVTKKALAAVALEYVDAKPTALGPLQARGDEDHLDPPALGTELRFKGDGEYDGDAVYLQVDTGRTSLPKCGEFDDGCVRLDEGENGGPVQLRWQELEPEEDPGIVEVTEIRDGYRVTVTFAGPDITGDPRQLATYFPVAKMQALVDDVRVGPTTTQEAVDAGDELQGWAESD